MSRSAKPTTAPAARDRTPAVSMDDIESEFLGMWMGIARLREKVLALASRAEPRPQP